MPDLQKNFVFSEAEFEKLFHEFDLDGNGTVEKDEMAEFIKNLLLRDSSSNGRGSAMSQTRAINISPDMINPMHSYDGVLIP